MGLRKRFRHSALGIRLATFRDRQCDGISSSTGDQCTDWAIRGEHLCHTHHRRRNARSAATALTGSVAAVQMAGAGWQTWRPGSRAWQIEAWRQYDITGQLRFVANWIGHSVSRCRLYVAEVDDSGEAGQEVDDDEEIAALAAGPLGQGPAKDEALRLLGINQFVAGECYVIAQAEGGPDGTDCWFVVSGQQIRRSGDQIIVRRSLLNGGGDMTYREGVDLILRVYTPHPADLDEPDSPTRSALPDLREIEAIRKREFAELDSRLAGAGMLCLPQNIDFPRGDDDPAGVKGFSQVLGRTMGTSLQDRASAEAMVPIMVTMPVDALDKVRLITFWSALSEQLLPMREAAIRSLAQSLDVPPEVLLGMSAGHTNHWTAWQIDESAISLQIVPVLQRIADALTTGYLKGALEAIGADPERYVYAFDTSPLTVRANRSDDAMTLHEAGILSDEAAIEAASFRTDQLPTPEERVRRLLEPAVTTDPSLLENPTVAKLFGFPTPPVEGLETPDAAEPAGPGGGEGTADDNPVQDPRALPQQPDSQDDNSEASQAAAIGAAAGVTVRRALSLAGTRLIPHQQRGRYSGAPKWTLHALHGPVSGARAETLLRGAWEDVPELAADLGVDPTQLQRLLHTLCVDLLTNGLTYDQHLLHGMLSVALTRRQLSPVRQLAAAA